MASASLPGSVTQCAGRRLISWMGLSLEFPDPSLEELDYTSRGQYCHVFEGLEVVCQQRFNCSLVVGRQTVETVVDRRLEFRKVRVPS